MESVATRELVGRRVGAAVFPGERTLDERRRASVWHSNGLPDTCGANSANVFLLEIAKKAVFGAEERSRGETCDRTVAQTVSPRCEFEKEDMTR